MSYIKHKVLFSRGRPQVCAHVGTLIALVAGIASTCRHAVLNTTTKLAANWWACLLAYAGLGPVNFGRFLALSWNAHSPAGLM